MNHDTVSGKFDQMKGKVKQSVGEAAGDDSMANSGAADQVKGAAKESWGSVKDAVNTPPRTSRTDTRSNVNADARQTAHDVREKVVSTAQNVKDSIKGKSKEERLRRSA